MSITIQDYYTTYSPLILQNVKKFLNKDHSEIAEDIVQEVFLKLIASNLNLDDDQLVSKWLFVVSRNTALNIINKRKRFVFTEEVITADTEVETWYNNEEAYSEKMIFIKASMAQLSPQKAHVIKKYKLEEKPIQTVAEEMNISVHTAKYYYKQAIQQLRDNVQRNKKNELILS